MQLKTREDATNDFDFRPEKKPALSTVKRQAKQLCSLIATAALSENKIITNLSFDRLKIWIDLDKYGKKIKFKKGINLVKSDHPSLPPYKQHRQSLELREDKGCGYDYDVEEEYMEEYDEEVVEDIGHKNTYPNCSIDYEIFKKILGINNVYIQNDKLVIDITGKIMADYGILGLISIDNIKECLEKLQKLLLFSFDIDKFLKHAGCYIADVTLDIMCKNSKQVSKILTAMSSFSPIISDRCVCKKFKRHGLQIKNKSDQTGNTGAAYSKGEEISNSIKKYDKSVRYTETIGDKGEIIAKMTLRLECHIYKMADLRKLLNIPTKEKGFVPLMAVLKSKEPVILKMLKKMGINEYKLKELLTWFILHDKFFNDDEQFTTKNEFQEIVMAEWLAKLVVENNYELDKVKSHIGIEYGFDLNDGYFETIMPRLKDSLYKYLCFRKPHSVTCVLILLELIHDEYFNTELQLLKKKVLDTT